MLSELSENNKVVGLKQLKKALRDDTATKVFIAKNADPKIIDPIFDTCRERSIPVEETPTMAELGKACGIEVGAAVAALLR